MRIAGRIVLPAFLAFCLGSAAIAPANGAAGKQYANPVIDAIGPADPTVIRVDGTYYLYPTGDDKGYDVFTSTDLVNWKNHGKSFVAPTGGAWAPDVFHNVRGDVKFYMYYTANGPAPAKRVGVAVADSPLGPFVDKGFLLNFDAIDAHLFQDTDGAMYLYYVDRRVSRISAQPMAAPLQKKGSSKSAVSPTKPWESLIVEGPWMIKRDKTYYLMYSGNGADGPDYAVGYATSTSPMGPFTKYPGNPVAKRGGGVLGPGHHCVVEGPRGDLWMVYHQKTDDQKNWNRFIAIDPLWFDADGNIQTKTTRGSPQPAP